MCYRCELFGYLYLNLDGRMEAGWSSGGGEESLWGGKLGSWGGRGSSWGRWWSSWRGVWSSFQMCKWSFDWSCLDLLSSNCSSLMVLSAIGVLYCSFFLWVSHLGRTRRYCPLCGPNSSSCGGLWPLPKAFFALRVKTTYYSVLSHGHFWCSVVTLVTFNSNLYNYEEEKI